MKKKLAILWLFFSTLPAGMDAAVFSAQQYDAMGTALYDKGFYDQALDYFQKAVKTDPYDWQGFENMGNAYLKMNHYQAAIDSFKKSLLINPQNIVLKMNLTNLVNQGGLGPSQTRALIPEVLSNVDTPPPSAANFKPQAVIKTTTPIDSPQAASTVSSSTTPSPAAPPPQGPTALLPPVNSVNSKPLVSSSMNTASPAPTAALQSPSSPSTPAQEKNGSHAKTWIKLWPAFTYSLLGDLSTSASAETNMIEANGWSGSSLAGNSGLGFGVEFGFQIDPSEGLAFGGNYLRINDYRLNQDLHNGSPSDFENETLSPYAISAELNYYFFLPDAGGRFFLSAGAAYYSATVHAEDDFSYLISHPGSGDAARFQGDLSAGGVGFQAGVGREFTLSPFMGVSLFARGRYARVSHLIGTVTQSDGRTARYGLAVFPDSEVHAIDVSLIGGSGVKYAALDFTGFDAGFAVTFYP